jgi:STE24 endopeptidase
MYEPVVPGQLPQPPAVRRLPDASSWLTAAMALPAFLSSLTVMALVGALVLPSATWVIPVLWILSGTVLFVPAIESMVSSMSFHVSRPSHSELTVLVSAWQAVCRVAGVDGSKYHLLIEDSDQPNAFAAGGRTVAVTRAALRLPPPELASVLAHELGHHLSAHGVVARLAWWYALPIRAAALLGGLAIRFVLAVGRVFLAFGNGLGALASLFLALILLTAIAFVSFWLLLVPLISPLLAWASRLGEYRADQTAAQLGYGPGLIQAFRRWQYAEANDRHADGLKARLLSTHPSFADRIRRLETMSTAW